MPASLKKLTFGEGFLEVLQADVLPVNLETVKFDDDERNYFAPGVQPPNGTRVTCDNEYPAFEL